MLISPDLVEKRAHVIEIADLLYLFGCGSAEGCPSQCPCIGIELGLIVDGRQYVVDLHLPNHDVHLPLSCECICHVPLD